MYDVGYDVHSLLLYESWVKWYHFFILEVFKNEAHFK